MPRTAAKNVPGTERYRDERRKSGGPRMHEREWHDHDEPHDLERVANSEGFDAVPEVESSGDRGGMGRVRTRTALSKGRERRKRTTPPSKGPKRKPETIKGTGHGRRGNRED